MCHKGYPSGYLEMKANNKKLFIFRYEESYLYIEKK